MIIEGLLTTLDSAGRPHLAPMGPEVDAVPFDLLRLKPFASSQSGRNLRDRRRGIFHATDDVALIARAAIGTAGDPTTAADSLLLNDFCWAVEVEVTEVDDASERWRLEAVVTRRHVGRAWTGFNRAQFAVVEAAILATRVGLLPAAQIVEDFDRLAVLVRKTGGPTEHAAFQLLREFIGCEAGK